MAASPRKPGQRGSLEPYIKDSVNFYGYQVSGVAWCKQRKSFLLADDMGLGKSLQALATFGMHLWELDRHYPGQGRSARMIVVCMRSLKWNWANEIEKFTGYQYLVLDGTPDKRRKQIFEYAKLPKPSVLIVNYEQVGAHLADLNALQFDIVCADEAHKLKNPKAKISIAFRNLVARRRWFLTGTPVENNPSEIWNILNEISPDQWGTFYQFRDEYCVMGGYGGKQITGVKNLGRLRTKMSDVHLRRMKKDQLELPPVQIIERRCKLLPEQRKLYNMIATDEPLLDAYGNEINEDNPATKYLRLQQVCGTSLGLYGMTVDVSAKLDLAEEDTEIISDEGNKIIVFTQFRNVLEAYATRIEKRLPKIPIYQINGDVASQERQALVDKWSSTKGPAIIAGTIKTMGTGFNMTAARHMLFLDRHHNPAINAQATDRANRIGADLTQNIQSYIYITRGTIEARLQQLLDRKTDMSTMMLDPNAPGFMNSEAWIQMLREKAEE